MVVVSIQKHADAIAEQAETYIWQPHVKGDTSPEERSSSLD
jgi:hypothetical protein